MLIDFPRHCLQFASAFGGFQLWIPEAKKGHGHVDCPVGEHHDPLSGWDMLKPHQTHLISILISNFLMATIGYNNHQSSSNCRAWNKSFEWFNLHRCLIKPHQHQQASTVQQGAQWSSLHPQRLPWMNQELFNGRIQFWDCGHETRGTCIHDV